jgi:hypothetical protein
MNETLLEANQPVAVSEFADKFPKGTTVNFYPIAGKRKPRVVVIRSLPWLLSDGTLVVKVKGITGAVSCALIEPHGQPTP